jgi:hypothetical protein
MRWGKFEGYFSAVVFANKQVMLARLKYLDMDEFDEQYGLKDDVDYQIPFPVARELQDDGDIMLALCLRSPQTLSRASAKLRNDPNFVLQILQEHPSAMQFVSKKLRGNKAFARKAMSLPAGIRGFTFLDPKIQKDAKVAILAIQKAGKEYGTFHMVHD